MFTREESNAMYEAADTAADLRCLAQGDLFFLLTRVMNRADIDNDWLYARCREVEANPDGYIDLWAREHYKSTIITVGKSIQDVLANPNITIGFFSHKAPIARAFLGQIKREFENNRLLQELFPHICPPASKEARTWSLDSGLIVRRTSNPKEATIEAHGLVEGQPTGKHFDVLVYDDVVTRESVYTPEQIAKTTEAWQLSLNLGAHGGKRRIIGTRYHFNDTYATILQQGSAIPRIYPATLDGKSEGEPVFLTPEALAEKRRDMGPYVFGCQMLQNPKADAVMGFKAEWLRYQPISGMGERIDHAGMHTYLLCDPAGGKKTDNDYTVMAVIGLGLDNNYYLIDALRDRLNLTERAARLFALHKKYRPLGVGYERYGMQADIEHIRYVQAREHYHFDINELGGQMPKVDRIRRLVPLFEQGRFYLPVELYFIDHEGRQRDFVSEFVTDEYRAFPVSAHDDMLDCLARITDPELGALFPLACASVSGRAACDFNENFF